MGSPPRAAVGFSVHTGWAVSVVITGARPRVLARHRLSLVAGEDDVRFVYHAAAEAPAQAAHLIGSAEKTAIERAAEFFKELSRELPDCTLIAALPRPKRILPPLEKILRAHPLIHTAEGELYRRSIAEAAQRAGIPVETPEPSELPDLGHVERPWSKDHRSAAALAWSALRGG